MDYTRLRNCELFLFDMDGTLYLGDEIFDGAVELMEDFPNLGKKYIYLTNNSSRAGTDYVTRLKGFGFPCESENVFTSGMATGLYLNQNHPGARVYLVGTQAFRRELLSYGINLVEEGADVVVVGFDTELVYEKLNKACHFLRRGATFIAANPDWVCPMPNDEVLPDCVDTLRVELLPATLRLELLPATLRLELLPATLRLVDEPATLRLEVEASPTDLDAIPDEAGVTVRLALVPNEAVRLVVLRLRLRSHPPLLILRLGV